MKYQDINKTDMQGAYLFYGKEQLLMDRAVNEIIEKYTTEDFRDFNVQTIDAKVYDNNIFVSAVETLPVFDSKKIVIIKNFVESLKNNQESIIEMLKQISEQTVLIFLDYENELLKTTKLYKYFSTKKTNIEFPKLNDTEFRKFLLNYIESKKLKISPVNLSYLAQKTGYNSRNINIVLYDVKNELDKIIVLCSNEITKELIDNAYVSNVDTNIFNFLEAVTTKNPQMALLELENLYQISEPIQKIFYMLSRQFKLMLTYSSLKSQQLPEAIIMSQLGIKSYEFSKIKANEKNFSYEKLLEIHRLLLEYDHTVKTKTVNERALFETLLIEIIK